jgi:hypothetical protein
VNDLADYFWLCLSAAAAGVVNALAGGGTLLTFPTLLGLLAGPFGSAAGVVANGTSTAALIPASLGSAWGFRRELQELRPLLFWLVPPSLIGGGIGTWLVVEFPDQFDALIPWLILVAATLFTIQPYLTRRISGKPLVMESTDGAATRLSPRSLIGMTLLQSLIAIYGGYFGAGIGILMLSGLGLMGLTNIHQMNGLKSVLAAAINGMAVIVFVASGKIVWPYALAMMAASLIGGYLAARYGRQIPGKYVRRFIIGIGFALAVYFFFTTYRG